MPSCRVYSHLQECTPWTRPELGDPYTSHRNELPETAFFDHWWHQSFCLKHLLAISFALPSHSHPVQRRGGKISQARAHPIPFPN